MPCLKQLSWAFCVVNGRRQPPSTSRTKSPLLHELSLQVPNTPLSSYQIHAISKTRRFQEGPPHHCIKWWFWIKQKKFISTSLYSSAQRTGILSKELISRRQVDTVRIYSNHRNACFIRCVQHIQLPFKFCLLNCILYSLTRPNILVVQKYKILSKGE